MVPSASSTGAYGPALKRSGYRIVGSYKRAPSTLARDHAFFYDSATKRYVTIDPPPSFCAPGTCDEAIAHSNFGDATFKIVGNCNTLGAGRAEAAIRSQGTRFCTTRRGRRSRRSMSPVP